MKFSEVFLADVANLGHLAEPSASLVFIFFPVFILILISSFVQKDVTERRILFFFAVVIFVVLTFFFGLYLLSVFARTL